MNNETTNPFVAIHSMLDEIIHSLTSNDAHTNASEKLDELTIVAVDETDKLITLKKKFLLGHCFAKKEQFPQAIACFKESSLLQIELSYEDVKIPTYTALFFCYQHTQLKVELYEYARLLESSQSIDIELRKTVLETIVSLLEFAGNFQDANEAIELLLTIDTNPDSIFKLRLQQSFIQLSLGENDLVRSKKLSQLAQLYQQLPFSKELSIQYLELLLQLKEYSLVQKTSGQLVITLSSNKEPYSEFLYYSQVASTNIASTTFTEEVRTKLVSACLQEKNTFYAIKSMLLYVTNDQLQIVETLLLLESAVEKFDKTIPIELQIEVFEKLVECCEVLQEWKKGLRYFELYHNCLQNFANEKKQRNIEKIQLQQINETFRQLTPNSSSQTVSSSLIQRHHQNRQEQLYELDKFVKAIASIVHKNIQTPFEQLLTLPKKQYSKTFGECVIDISKKMIINIESIIELHSLEEGSYSGVSETVTVKKILELLQPQFQNFANLYECTVELFVDASVQWYGDIHLLSKVMYHIVHNACKFSLKHSTIVLTVSVTNSNLLINITDSGIGVAQEHLGLVFLKYFQYDPLNFQTHSAGIGLTYCKYAIDYIQGSIELTSKKDVGTEVTISLPISSMKEQPAPKTPTNIISPLPNSLSKDDVELLKPYSFHSFTQSIQLVDVLEQIDSLQGSKQFDNWKRQLYTSILSVHKEKNTALLEQIS